MTRKVANQALTYAVSTVTVQTYTHLSQTEQLIYIRAAMTTTF